MLDGPSPGAIARETASAIALDKYPILFLVLGDFIPGKADPAGAARDFKRLAGSRDDAHVHRLEVQIVLKGARAVASCASSLII
jgi:hypothetical protein